MTLDKAWLQWEALVLIATISALKSQREAGGLGLGELEVSLDYMRPCVISTTMLPSDRMWGKVEGDAGLKFCDIKVHGFPEEMCAQQSRQGAWTLTYFDRGRLDAVDFCLCRLKEKKLISRLFILLKPWALAGHGKECTYAQNSGGRDKWIYVNQMQDSLVYVDREFQPSLGDIMRLYP